MGFLLLLLLREEIDGIGVCNVSLVSRVLPELSHTLSGRNHVLGGTQEAHIVVCVIGTAVNHVHVATHNKTPQQLGNQSPTGVSPLAPSWETNQSSAFAIRALMRHWETIVVFGTSLLTATKCLLQAALRPLLGALDWTLLTKSLAVRLCFLTNDKFPHVLIFFPRGGDDDIPLNPFEEETPLSILSLFLAFLSS